MPNSARSEPAPFRMTLRLRMAAALGAAVILVAILAAWLWADVGSPASAPTLLPAARAEGIVRRTEVAFADAQSVWDRAVRTSRPREYRRADLVFFSRPTASPCATAPVSGSFYCPDTGVAAFDLMYLDTLGERLRRRRDLGLALYAARVSAQHLQRELGVLDRAAVELVGARRGRRAEITLALALQADCLVGVWAAAAEPRLGPMPAGFWDELLWSSRNVTDDLRRAGVEVPVEFDVFAAGSRAARDTAFAEGYAAGRIEECRLALSRGAN
jgi:predicted metalloprotease